MKIKAILWDHRALSNKTYPIKIRLTVGSKVKYFPVHASVTHKQWDKSSGRVKTNTRDNAMEINDKIRSMLNSIESNYLAGTPLVPTNSSSHNDFYAFFQQRIDYVKSKHSFGHYKRLKTVLQKLKEYRTAVSIPEITYDYLHGFERFLLKRGNSPNTIHENFVRVKTVVKELIKSGLMDYHKDPFHNFKVEKKRVERVRLTIAQIHLLQSFDIPNNHKAKCKARDMYMFSFYCAGVRFADMCRLTKANFKQQNDNDHHHRLQYVMNKTGKQRNIVLIPEALAIIKKYRGYSFGIKNNFNSISSANAYYNKLLKEIAKSLNIPPISFHTSRHSFMDYAIKTGIDIHTIKDLLGHSRVSMTEDYGKSFYEEKTDDAMNKLFPSTIAAASTTTDTTTIKK